ncbi:hypothetical protein Tco_1236520 [Tanacetum coccineum]
MPTLKTSEVDMMQNDEALEINLDLLEERREHTAIREAKSKTKIEKYYNSKVRSTSFKPGDLVYRSNDASRAEEVGKLGPKWEGSYEITEALVKGAYKLRDRDGKQLSRTWNIRNLKKCYVYEMNELFILAFESFFLSKLCIIALDSLSCNSVQSENRGLPRWLVFFWEVGCYWGFGIVKKMGE